MAYRYGNCSQMMLLPQSIREYIPGDHPVRVYDVSVEALDFGSLHLVPSGQVHTASEPPRAKA